MGNKKSQAARARHHQQKRRARVSRILNKYRGDRYWAEGSTEKFEQLIAELAALNVKYLTTLHEDLTRNPGFQDPNRPLRERVEALILEKTVLK